MTVKPYNFRYESRGFVPGNISCKSRCSLIANKCTRAGKKVQITSTANQLLLWMTILYESIAVSSLIRQYHSRRKQSSFPRSSFDTESEQTNFHTSINLTVSRRHRHLMPNYKRNRNAGRRKVASAKLLAKLDERKKVMPPSRRWRLSAA